MNKKKRRSSRKFCANRHQHWGWKRNSMQNDGPKLFKDLDGMWNLIPYLTMLATLGRYK